VWHACKEQYSLVRVTASAPDRPLMAGGSDESKGDFIDRETAKWIDDAFDHLRDGGCSTQNQSTKPLVPWDKPLVPWDKPPWDEPPLGGKSSNKEKKSSKT
jgi:hypothetical protein